LNRVVIYFNEGYVNLEADRIQETKSYIRVYKNNELVGTFRKNEIKMVYKSAKGGS
jgi:hypothetical protein